MLTRNRIVALIIGILALASGIAYAAGGWTHWQVYVQNSFGVANSARTGATTLGTTAVGTDVLHIDGIASQTADMLEIDNSSGTSLLKVEDDGKITQYTGNASTSTFASTALSRAAVDQAYIWRMDDASSTSTATTGAFTGKSTDYADIKNFGLYVVAQHPSSSDMTGDSRDATAKVSYSNFGQNEVTTFKGSGLEMNVANRAAGTLYELHGIDMIVQGLATSTTEYIRGIYLNIESAVASGTTPLKTVGIQIDLENSVAKPTASYGVEVNNIGTFADSFDSAYKVTDSGDNQGFVYAFDSYGSTVSADIRMETAGTLENTVLGTISSATSGFKPKSVTADPCSGMTEGTIFYNGTSHYLCYCNGSNDVKMSDDTTACF